jgi:hypothetical protein
VSLAAVAAARLGGGDLGSAGLLAYEFCVAGSVLGLAVDLRRGDWAASAVAGLVADLGRLEMPGALSERPARALGDPDLAVAIRARDGWVDAGGAPIAEPVAGPGQVPTPIEHERLQAELRAQLAELRASRARIIATGDASGGASSATWTTGPNSAWSRSPSASGSRAGRPPPMPPPG